MRARSTRPVFTFPGFIVAAVGGIAGVLGVAGLALEQWAALTAPNPCSGECVAVRPAEIYLIVPWIVFAFLFAAATLPLLVAVRPRRWRLAAAVAVGGVAVPGVLFYLGADTFAFPGSPMPVIFYALLLIGGGALLAIGASELGRRASLSSAALSRAPPSGG